MKPDRNYLSSVFWITLAVILLLGVISLLPGRHIAGLYIKPVNILSDVIDREEDLPAVKAEPIFDTTLLATSEAEVLDAMQTPETVAVAVATTEAWELDPAWQSRRPARREVPSGELPSELVPIEDFGEGGSALAAFYRAWADSSGRKPLRIAVLGDSYIEGDILTADLREQLQGLHGGSGVGFVPFATAMNTVRGSVSHQYDRWTIRTLSQRASLPESLKDKFFVSGNFAQPQEGATVKLKGTDFRRYLDRVERARLLFINGRATQIEVQVNDSASRVFNPPPDEQVQQIIVEAPIRSLRVKLTQTEGFIGYGIILEDRQGVSVDNFSIRGNSGMALFGTSRSVNQQIASLAGYDLLILQYGLNVMSADVKNYDSYRDKLVNVIRYMQQCFPGAAILVMGVGDRSTQRGGQFVTMPGVWGMLRAQREAARETGTAFWDTFDAMGGPGGMAEFVKNKWAAQDYTHLRHPGGRVLATKLVESLVYGQTDAQERERREAQQQARRALQELQYQNHLETQVLPAADTQATATPSASAADTTPPLRHPDTVSQGPAPDTSAKKGDSLPAVKKPDTASHGLTPAERFKNKKKSDTSASGKPDSVPALPRPDTAPEAAQTPNP